MTPNHGLPLPDQPTGYLATLRSQPLAAPDIHIWCLPLNGSVDEFAYYESTLSVDEQTRAQRFRFADDQKHYIFGRGILRTLLGGYLQMEAAQIHFVYGLQGKPSVETKLQNQTLQFNLAHSNGHAIYAFNWDRSIGVDLEYIRPMPDADDLAKRFFTPHENTWLKSFTGDEYTEAFFKLWTCKEAFLKANGSGLTTPLDQFDISIDENNHARITSLTGTAADSAWSLKLLNPISKYQAAIALDRQIGQVIFLSANDSA